jgi:hypothetical protein
MAKPVRLEVNDGEVGRGSRFYPNFVVTYDNGSRASGPFHIFKPHLSLQQTTPGIVEFKNSRFTRNPGVEDDVATCVWNYSDSGGSVQGTSTVNVSGQPAQLEVSSGEVGRGGRFYHRVRIVFTDGTEQTGPYHLFRTQVLLAGQSSDGIVLQTGGGIDRVPGAKDETVTCHWEYTESGVTLQTSSTVKVSGQPESIRVRDGEVGHGGVFYPFFDIRYTDGSSVTGPLHAVGSARPVLIYANPDIVVFHNSGFRLKPKAPSATVECAWTYTESGASVNTLSSVEAIGAPESHLCLSDPQNVTPDSVLEAGDKLPHSYPDRLTPVTSEDDELIFQASQPAGLPVNVDVLGVGGDSDDEDLSEDEVEVKERTLKFDLASDFREIAVPLIKGAVNLIKFQVEGADPLLVPPKFLFVTQISLNQQQQVALQQQQQQQRRRRQQRKPEITEEKMIEFVEKHIIEAKKFSSELAQFFDDWVLHNGLNHETSRTTGQIKISRPQIRITLEAIRDASNEADRAGIKETSGWSMIEVLLHEAGHRRAVINRRHKFANAEEEDRNVTELVNRLIDILENLNDILCNRNHKGRHPDSAEIESSLRDFAEVSLLFDKLRQMIFDEKVYRWSEVLGIKTAARNSELRIADAGLALVNQLNALRQSNLSREEKIKRGKQLVEDFHRKNQEDFKKFEEETGLTYNIQYDETCLGVKVQRFVDAGKFGRRKMPIKGDCR